MLPQMRIKTGSDLKALATKTITVVTQDCTFAPTQQCMHYEHDDMQPLDGKPESIVSAVVFALSWITAM